MDFKMSTYVISSALESGDRPGSQVLIYSTRTGTALKITKYVLALLHAGAFAQLPDKLFIVLMYNEIIVPGQENELATIVRRKVLSAANQVQKKNQFCFSPFFETLEVINKKLRRLGSI